MADYQLANQQNWEYLWGESFQAQKVPNSFDRYYSIPEIEVPVLLESNVIAVYASSLTAAPHWKFAGLVKQKLQLGLTVGGGQDGYGVKVRKIWLNQITLIEFRNLADSFSISIKVPYWLEQIQLMVWQYIGPVTTTDFYHSQLLEEIKAKVNEP